MEWHFEQTVDLGRSGGVMLWPDLMMTQGDHEAHEWRVTVLDDNAPADLAGYTVTAWFERSDGKRVPVMCAMVGNRAVAALPQAVYAAGGQLTGLMRASKGGQVLTLAAGRWNVRRAQDGEIADPEHVLPSVDELMARIREMEQATDAANTAAGSANAAADAASAAAAATGAAVETANAAADAFEQAAGILVPKMETVDAAAQDVLYRDEMDSTEMYAKVVPAGALPWARIGSVGGKTLVFNQLWSNFINETINGVAFTSDTTKSTITANGTATANVQFRMCNYAKAPKLMGHKILLRGCPANGSTSTYYLNDDYNIGGTIDIGNGVVYTCNSTENIVYAKLTIKQGVNCENLVFVPQVFDLTAMLGAEVADTITTPEQAYALGVPRTPKPYTPNELRTFSPKMVASKGLNLWDEQAEVGMISDTTGLPVDGASYLRTKNFIPVTPNTTIPTTIPTAAAGRVYFYGHNKEYLSYTYTGRVVETPKDCWYLKFRFGIGYGTSYHHDISIGTEEYAPYFRNDIDLSAIVQKYFPEGMRSAGEIHDEIDLERIVAIRRVGSVKLKELQWMHSDPYPSIAYASISDMDNTEMGGKVVSDVFSCVSACAGNLDGASHIVTALGEACASANTSRPYIYANLGSDAMNAAAAVGEGVVVYALAVPVETPITEAIAPWLRVEAGGTIAVENDQGEAERVPLPTTVLYRIRKPGGGGGVELDRTLTDPEKAAPADMVGEVKSALRLVEDALIGVDEAADALMEVVGV